MCRPPRVQADSSDFDSEYQCNVHLQRMTAWYHEHLRSYEVCKSSSNLIATQLAELNDIVPLSAYRVKGQLLITLKCYILC